MILTDPNRDKIRQSILDIKLGFRDPGILKQLKEKYNAAFEGHIKTDKDIIIKAIKTFKKKGLLEYCFSCTVDNHENHEHFMNSTDTETYALYEFIQSQGILDETIPAYTLLNNTKALKLDILIPDLVSRCFSIYEDIYNKSKADIALIREHAEKTTHFAVQELHSMLDDSSFHKIMDEGRRISNEQSEAQKAIITALKKDSRIDNNIDELQDPFERLELTMTEMSAWQDAINEFIFATGYKELLHKHFETLGVDFGREKHSTDEVYQSMDHYLSQSNPFVGMMQNKLTNEMNKIDLRSKKFSINHANTGVLKSGNLTFLIPDFKGSDGLNVSNKLFLSFLYHQLTLNSTDPKVTVPLEKYMKMRGNEVTPSNKKEIRKNVLSLMEPLKKIRFIQQERGRASGEIALYGGTARVVRGFIEFRFNPDYFEVLREARISPMPIHVNIYKIDTQRRPHSYYIACKMAEHDHLSRSNTFSLKTKYLVNSCPELPLPDELSNGQVQERILEPFFKSLDHLKEIGVLNSFDFILANGDIRYPENYEDLMESKITYTYCDPYPKKKVLPKSKKEGVRKDA